MARIKEANAENQQKAFYNLRASEIRGLWAQGIFEKDASKVADARSQIADWNAKKSRSAHVDFYSIRDAAREGNK